MNKKLKFIFIASILLTVSFSIVFAATRITSISIVPDLDISLFSPYKIESTITGNPNSVSVEIFGVNGEDANAWDYYVDGTSTSQSVTKTMTDVGDKWQSTNVYPDSIYPEIFFAPSSIT